MSKSTNFSKTIYALATALGTGSIAVIRLSGPDAINIASRIFHGKNLQKVKTNTVHFGKISGSDRTYDQVLVSVFRAPHSYTGENYIEISSHANLFVVDDVMRILSEQGAVAAGPGEFTLRSFLNGKQDLAQAEAVAALIQAKSRMGAKNSLAQLNGELSNKIWTIRNDLIDIIGLMEIDLDFSEEELPVVSGEELVSKLRAIDTAIGSLIGSFNYGRLLKDGINLAIIGETNVGKSTLLNQLLGENRAITSHIPGTTRDTIQEALIIRDILFNLVDTAGLRETGNRIESEGINRTRAQIERADLVLLVVDGSRKLSERSLALIKKTMRTVKGKTILVSNKLDLRQHQKSQYLLQALGLPLVCLSARQGDGIDRLKEIIFQEVSAGMDIFSDQLIITSERQFDILRQVKKDLSAAIKLLQNHGGFEFAALDLRQALEKLGQISGETATDDILNHVFSKFCIGK